MSLDVTTYALLKKKIVELEKSLSDKGLKFKLVEQLPETGELNVIYLIKLQSDEQNNYYEEYVYLENGWEKLGTTQINLDGVARKDYVDLEIEKVANKKISYNDLIDTPVGDIVSYERTTLFENTIYAQFDGPVYPGLNFNITEHVDKTLCFTLDGEEYIGQVTQSEYLYKFKDASKGFSYTYNSGEEYIRINGSIFNPPEEGSTLKIEELKEVSTIKQLDEQYIPDSIARKSDIENKIYDDVLLKDEGNGIVYTLKMVNGVLVTLCDINRLEVVTLPTKMLYYVGDKFEPDGMSIKAIYEDDTERDVTEQVQYDENITDEDHDNFLVTFMNKTIFIPIKVSMSDPFIDDLALSNFIYTWDEFNHIATITGLKDTSGETVDIIIPDDDRIVLDTTWAQEEENNET